MSSGLPQTDDPVHAGQPDGGATLPIVKEDVPDGLAEAPGLTAARRGFSNKQYVVASRGWPIADGQVIVMSEGKEPVVRLGRDAGEAERLAALVEAHQKWATSYPLGVWPVPQPGTFIQIEHPWSKRCTRVRVRDVGVCRMSEVTLEFAFAEGCSSLKEWRELHGEFYRMLGAADNDPMIVQMWFRADANGRDA